MRFATPDARIGVMLSMHKAFLLGAGVLILIASDRSASAFDLGLGLLKRKQTKPDPVSRAKQLTATLQSDPDEQKRKAASKEMRGLDPRQSPEIVPALTSALQKDPSSEVRIEAVESLGLLKPISQPAGLAMEAALTTDPDPKVREAIKAALWQYSLNGYRTPPGGAALATQTTEPKLAGKYTPPTTTTSAKPATKPGEVGFQPIRNLIGKAPATLPLTAEPPLAKTKIPPVTVPTTPPVPAPVSNAPKPMPEVKPVVPTPMPMPAATPPSSLPLPSIPVPSLPFPVAPPPTLPLPSIPTPAVPTLPPLPDKPF